MKKTRQLFWCILGFVSIFAFVNCNGSINPNTPIEKAETFTITIKADGVPAGSFEISYQPGDTATAVKYGNIVKITARVSNLKINNAPVEKSKSIELTITKNTVIEIVYATSETLTYNQKLVFDKELTEAAIYEIRYADTPAQRIQTLQDKVASRLKYGSAVAVEFNNGTYSAKLTKGTETETAVLTVVEVNNFCRMVMIPASGNIKLGGGDCSEENPEHSANVAAYKLSETLVTQKLFKEIMGFNPSVAIQNVNNGEDKELRPVDSVNWYTAAEFCNRLTKKVMGEEHCVYNIVAPEWITSQDADPLHGKAQGIKSAKITIDKTKKGFRLPSGDEWEWAAGCGSPFKYAGSDTLNEVAWNGENAGDVTHEVKKLKPNKFGLYDMTGNLWELSGDLLMLVDDEFKPYTGNIADNNKQSIQRGACAYCPLGQYPDFFQIKFLRSNWMSTTPDISVTDWKSGFRIACNRSTE